MKKTLLSLLLLTTATFNVMASDLPNPAQPATSQNLHSPYTRVQNEIKTSAQETALSSDRLYTPKITDAPRRKISRRDFGENLIASDSGLGLGFDFGQTPLAEYK